MKKVLSALVVLGLLVGTPAIGQAQNVSIAEGCVRIGVALATGDISQGIQGLVALANGVEGKLTERDIAALQYAVGELQKACQEIPELRSRIEVIQRKLKQQDVAMASLRNNVSDLWAEARVQQAAIEKLQRGFVNLSQRTTKLEMRDDDMPCKVRLATGTLLEGMILQRVENEGVTVLTRKGEKQRFEPGVVLTVTTLTGTWQWVQAEKKYIFHPADKALASGTPGSPKAPVQLIENDSREQIYADLKVILNALGSADLTRLINFAELRGFDWDKLGENNKLDMLKAMLKQDHLEDIKGIMRAQGCDEAVALRQIIHRRAQWLQKEPPMSRQR